MTDTTKTRPPRFLLQMKDDLRQSLEKAAIANGRTLTAEINTRLRDSLKGNTSSAASARGAGDSSTYPAWTNVVHTNEKGPVRALTDSDQAILDAFRALPVEKQLALLSLLR